MREHNMYYIKLYRINSHNKSVSIENFWKWLLFLLGIIIFLVVHRWSHRGVSCVLRCGRGELVVSWPMWRTVDAYRRGTVHGSPPRCSFSGGTSRSIALEHALVAGMLISRLISPMWIDLSFFFKLYQ